ncbi:phosphatase PAP2 family protein [Streptosporangium sp. CA-135522]|uniref:phosphatase PAP2 family protein n=1 Tax=Streptosporangium sp. CA-135522 TaxID=3240072 RepID=UPI003D936F75
MAGGAAGPSWPSRHTTTAVLGGLVIAGQRAARPRAVLCGVSLAGAVGASRLYLGVHWPGDVIAATVFALAWWAAGTQVAGCLAARRRPGREPGLPDRSALIGAGWRGCRWPRLGGGAGVRLGGKAPMSAAQAG